MRLRCSECFRPTPCDDEGLPLPHVCEPMRDRKRKKSPAMVIDGAKVPTRRPRNELSLP